MKLTNQLALPEPFVEAVRNDGYSKGDAEISVTGLLRPAKARVLEKRHWDEIEEDVSDRVWAVMGQALHTILERAKTQGIRERRLYTERFGWRISGQMDLYLDGVLYDYKTTSAWKVLKGLPKEWTEQCNLYAHLLRQNGEPVSGLKVIALFRDWSILESERSSDYPKTQVQMFEIPLWPPGKAEEFLRQRVLAHQAAERELPECTAEERWERPTIYAVMKPGRKSAIKLHDTQEDALAHCLEDGSYFVQTRPGASVRCLHYCSVSNFCDQAKQSGSGR